jgi:hypothetical protein
VSTHLSSKTSSQISTMTWRHWTFKLTVFLSLHLSKSFWKSATTQIQSQKVLQVQSLSKVHNRAIMLLAITVVLFKVHTKPKSSRSVQIRQTQQQRMDRPMANLFGKKRLYSLQLLAQLKIIWTRSTMSFIRLSQKTTQLHLSVRKIKITFSVS